MCFFVAEDKNIDICVHPTFAYFIDNKQPMSLILYLLSYSNCARNPVRTNWAHARPTCDLCVHAVCAQAQQQMINAAMHNEAEDMPTTLCLKV